MAMKAERGVKKFKIFGEWHGIRFSISEINLLKRLIEEAEDSGRSESVLLEEILIKAGITKVSLKVKGKGTKIKEILKKKYKTRTW